MNGKIAIVGMEAIFGAACGLAAFDCMLFDGIRHSVPPCADGREKAQKGMESRVKEDYIRRVSGSTPSSPGALMDDAVEGALKDTISKADGNRWSDTALVWVPEGDSSRLPSRTEGCFREDSIHHALQKAMGLLSGREARCVVVGTAHAGNGGREGASSEEGACAVALKSVEHARQDQDRIYAVLEAVVIEPSPSSPPTGPSVRDVSRISRKALEVSGVSAGQIDYLEVSAPGIEDDVPVELEGLVDSHQDHIEPLRCALGSVKANIGSVCPSALLAGLIKTALSLYHRYIPASPQWTGPRDRQLWQRSPFYVATESRPWFLGKASSRRSAAVNSIEPSGMAHLILSEDAELETRPNRYLSLVSPYCFPLSGNDPHDLLEGLEALQRNIEESSSLLASAKENLVRFQGSPRARFALVVGGHNKEEILKEIQFMRKGVPSAFEKGSEWKTPQGSFFTPNPLGENGQVAYVYPGIGSAYVGLGQGMVHLFPEIMDRYAYMAPRMGELLKERDLYPRSVACLSEDEIWKRELRLRKDIMAIAECGMIFFKIYTLIMKDIFKVEPHCALGYSMGEPGMMASLGAWSDPVELIDRFAVSVTFRERLHDRLTAVREYWERHGYRADPGKKVWETYTLITTPEAVRDAIRDEARVFLTIISAPEEVVIAGDPESCLRVIKKIRCKYYALGLDLAIHSEPTRLEHGRIADLYNLPTEDVPGIRFYSSSCYQPIPPRSKAVANSIARAFCEPVDFPRLVNRSYEDGARIFIELGSRAFCSNLISRILKGKDHLAIPVNVKGVKEQTAIVRVLAQLVSHRVPVDLSPLF